MQSMAIINAIDCRLPTYVLQGCALYRLDLKGSGDKVAWIEKSAQRLHFF
jgi:hypothetical protein